MIISFDTAKVGSFKHEEPLTYPATSLDVLYNLLNAVIVQRMEAWKPSSEEAHESEERTMMFELIDKASVVFNEFNRIVIEEANGMPVRTVSDPYSSEAIYNSNTDGVNACTLEGFKEYTGLWRLCKQSYVNERWPVDEVVEADQVVPEK